MRGVPGTRNRIDPSQDAPLLMTEEADLLIEAISLLGQRQQETEAWAAERVHQADERAQAVEQRQLELERRLESLEQRLAQLGEQIEPELPAGGPDERLARLRQHVEELRGVATAFEDNSVEPPALVAPVSVASVPPRVEPPAPPSPPRIERPSAPARQPRAAQGSDFWQRLEQFPPRADTALLLLGLLVVLYAGLWQIAQVLGFG
jgi:hypothetical protein